MKTAAKIIKLFEKIFNSTNVVTVFVAVTAFHLLLVTSQRFIVYAEAFIFPYLKSAGFIPYKQIIDHHFPGLLFFDINFYSLGVRSYSSALAWYLAVVVILQVLIYMVARKVFGSSRKALLANVLYMAWQPFFEGNVFWIDSIIPIFLLASYGFLIREKELKVKNLFLSGFFLGIAVLCKQTVLVYVVTLLVYLMLTSKQRIKVLPSFLVGFSVPVFYLLYFIFDYDIISEFYYWNFTYNSATLPLTTVMIWPSVRDIVKLTPVIGVFLLSSATFVLKRKIPPSLKLLIIFAVCGFSFVFYRPDYIHYQPMIPFVIIWLAYLLLKLTKNKQFRMVWAYVLISVVLLAHRYISLYGPGVTPTYPLSTRKVVEYLGKNVKERSVYLFRTSPVVYVFSHTIPSGNYFSFEYPWIMEVETDRKVSDFRQNLPEIVVVGIDCEEEKMLVSRYNKEMCLLITKNYQVVQTYEEHKIVKKI